jgi:hypothetical protein
MLVEVEDASAMLVLPPAPSPAERSVFVSALPPVSPFLADDAMAVSPVTVDSDFPVLLTLESFSSVSSSVSIDDVTLVPALESVLESPTTSDSTNKSDDVSTFPPSCPLAEALNCAAPAPPPDTDMSASSSTRITSFATFVSGDDFE